MKKILLPLLALLLLVSCGENQKSEGPAIVTGKWGRGKMEKINLYKLENGQMAELASSTIATDSSFTFAFQPTAGEFYYVGNGKSAVNRYAFYLKPGDNLNFTITDTSYVLTGKNSAENIEMTKWHDFVQPLEWKAIYFMKGKSTYVDFFPLLEEKLEENYPKSKTKNKAFNEAFEEYKKFNMLNIAIHFTYTPRIAHPEGEDFSDYYRNIDIADLTKNASAMNYPGGVDLISKVIFNGVRCNRSLSGEEKKQMLQDPVNTVMDNMNTVVNDTIKGELTLQFAVVNRSLPGLNDYDEKYGKYLVTEDQKSRMKDMKNALNDLTEGQPAIDFKFANETGKMVSLSDFKGKVVYIDIWATWCGPCKQEIPHLKKLEQEYHNKDIVFVSVSTDKSADHQKWKDFIAKEEMKGVQLFAGDSAPKDLIEPYKVKGIPHFVLVGKDGNLILSKAPRPSSSEIRLLLNDSLK